MDMCTILHLNNGQIHVFSVVELSIIYMATFTSRRTNIIHVCFKFPIRAPRSLNNAAFLDICESAQYSFFLNSCMTTSFHLQHLYTETETETINVIGCKWKNIIIGLMDVPRLTDTLMKSMMTKNGNSTFKCELIFTSM